jgi:ectoine hydroxylase-related dioxygenase (phytanoyl-CoA dioxygenase family)
MEALLGPHILFWSDKVVFKGEGADYGTPWHQDWPYRKGIHKVTLGIALDDIDESNGCLLFVRGSQHDTYAHHAGSGESAVCGHQLDISEIDAARVVPIPCPVGTAVACHALTLHASHPNSAHRHALTITDKDAAAEDLDYPAMRAAAVVRGHGQG